MDHGVTCWITCIHDRCARVSTLSANIVLTACSRDGNLKAALTQWRQMIQNKGPAPDKASLAAVILACGRAGRADLAMEARQTTISPLYFQLPAVDSNKAQC